MPRQFYSDFRENMKKLNLPAPESMFGTLTTATASIGPIVKFVQTYGTRATVAEMIFTLPGAVVGAGGGVVGLATAASEGLLVIGALSPAYYVDACIGSLAVATGKSLSGVLSLAECISTAQRHGIKMSPWVQSTLISNTALLGWPSGSSIDRHPTSAA